MFDFDFDFALNLRRTSMAFAVSLTCLVPAQAGVITLGTLADPTNYGADCTFWCVQRYQQVYSAAEFSGIIDLTRVSFFAAPTNGSVWNGSSTWRMTLSTTSKSVGGLDAAFDDNLGADAAVFDTKTFTGEPAFGDLISFTGSFDYDASMGNLLVDIERISGSAEGAGLQAVYNTGVFDRAYAFDSNLTADGGLNQDYGNRSQFEFDSVNGVPEPTTLALVSGAMLLLGLGSRRCKAAFSSL